MSNTLQRTYSLPALGAIALIEPVIVTTKEEQARCWKNRIGPGEKSVFPARLVYKNSRSQSWTTFETHQDTKNAVDYVSHEPNLVTIENNEPQDSAKLSTNPAEEVSVISSPSGIALDGPIQQGPQVKYLSAYPLDKNVVRYNGTVRAAMQRLSKDSRHNSPFVVIGRSALLLLGHTVKVRCIDLLVDRSKVSKNYWKAKLNDPEAVSFVWKDGKLFSLLVKHHGRYQKVVVKEHSIYGPTLTYRILKERPYFISNIDGIPLLQTDLMLAIHLQPQFDNFESDSRSFTHRVGREEIYFLIEQLVRTKRKIPDIIRQTFPVYPFTMWRSTKDLRKNYVKMLVEVGGLKLLAVESASSISMDEYYYTLLHLISIGVSQEAAYSLFDNFVTLQHETAFSE